MTIESKSYYSVTNQSPDGVNDDILDLTSPGAGEVWYVDRIDFISEDSTNITNGDYVMQVGIVSEQHDDADPNPSGAGNLFVDGDMGTVAGSSGGILNKTLGVYVDSAHKIYTREKVDATAYSVEFSVRVNARRVL